MLAARGITLAERERLVLEHKRFIVRLNGNESVASLGERLGSQVLDTIIALVLLFVPILFRDIIGNGTIMLGLILFLAYLFLADGLPGGQSLGKRVLDIAVIHRDTGRPCGYLRSLVRNVSLSFFGVIDWIFIFGTKRQRLGDLMANTAVIKKLPIDTNNTSKPD